MLDRLSRIPGVTATTASVGFPVVGSTRASLSIFGRTDETGRDEVMYVSLSPGFVGATGMRLIEGRDLSSTDDESAPPVVLNNESMARQYWPGGDPVGARVRIGPGTTDPWITVVGIVADIRQNGPTLPVIATSFGSTLQYSWPRRHFSIRSAPTTPALAAELRSALRAVDRELPMGPILTVDDMVQPDGPSPAGDAGADVLRVRRHRAVCIRPLRGRRAGALGMDPGAISRTRRPVRGAAGQRRTQRSISGAGRHGWWSEARC